MAAFFCDSSAIVKRYIAETGSTYIDGFADLKTGNIVLLARITRVEVAAAFARRLKAGSLTIADAQNGLALFQHDLTNNYFTVEITPVLLSEAMRLATQHALRGYDAVQLAAVLQIENELKEVGAALLIFVSADEDLNQAAKAEGLSVENPDN